ncbi:MAG TPA: antitoxin family protein [Gemmataceae bacterium]|jgi:predicted DNA-binding antitoxin AbrB/MazE fold protein|nr:antitoxin family protein [Gemmataceae bacterium]
MARTIEAVYEQGVFRPVEPVDLDEGQRVQIYLPVDVGQLPPEIARKRIEDIQKAFGSLTDEEWAEIAESWRRGK